MTKTALTPRCYCNDTAKPDFAEFFCTCDYLRKIETMCENISAYCGSESCKNWGQKSRDTDL